MVLRRAASTAACLLVHRASSFTPPLCRSVVQSSLWGGRQKAMSQRQEKLHAESGKGVPVTTAMKGSAEGGDVFAFDFDGVICNSQGESSRSGFRALRRLCPEVTSQLQAEHGGGNDGGDEPPAWVLEKMRELRPVVETGYENILLVRLLIEEKLGSTSCLSDSLLETWGPETRDELALRYGLSRQQLIDAFGESRDEWMEKDFQGWLGTNSFYKGVREAIADCEGEVYVITTKQRRFASALLEHAGVQVPVDRIFGLGTGPKADVLTELKAKHSDSTLHFFEDRVETLETVCADDRLEGVRLYLCDWGFNTSAQKARGESNSRIDVVNTGNIAGVLAPNAHASSAEARP